MAMWVFGYGSLIWKTGFPFDDRLLGCIKDYRRVFHQGSTDHRGTPEFPGRTLTLEPANGEVCWGVAYKITKEEDKKEALEHLEVREKQYDHKEYLDFFTDSNASEPAVSRVMVYIASPDKKSNINYLGPAPLQDIAKLLRRKDLQDQTETICSTSKLLLFNSIFQTKLGAFFQRPRRCRMMMPPTMSRFVSIWPSGTKNQN